MIPQKFFVRWSPTNQPSRKLKTTTRFDLQALDLIFSALAAREGHGAIAVEGLAVGGNLGLIYGPPTTYKWDKNPYGHSPAPCKGVPSKPYTPFRHHSFPFGRSGTGTKIFTPFITCRGPPSRLTQGVRLFRPC